MVASLEYRRGPGRLAGHVGRPDTALAALPGLLDGARRAHHDDDVRRATRAGGHLVLWLANQPHPVDRVVALAPVGDLRAAAEHGMGSGAAVDFLGGTPEQVPEVYDAADPATRMRDASRGRRRRRARRPRRGRAGGEQPGARGRGSTGWTTASSPGADHFDVIDPLSRPGRTVLAAVRG